MYHIKNLGQNDSRIVTDYATTDSVDKWYSWDVTKLAKNWYTLPEPNNNFGFQLETLQPNNASLVNFVSKNNTQYPSDGPQLTVNYKEFVGEENYWSYTSHDAGLNGSGQVNNYAGTLSVSENVLSYSGTRNPLSLANTYNNVNYNEHANSYIHTQTFAGGYSHSSSTGLGFRMSFNKLIYPIATTDSMYINGWRYVYVDGDGTQHYFKTDGTNITDEDGLNLTLTEVKDTSSNVTGITLTDIKNNVLTFGKPYTSDSSYVLTASTDNESNTTNYFYEYQPGTAGSKISRIDDATGRETHVTYDLTTGMVTSVIDSDSKTTTFTYSGEKLTEITYPDGLKTGYVYDNQGRLSGVWTSEGTGSSVGYQYASNDFEDSNFFKIRSVTEYGSQNFDPKTAGNSTSFSYLDVGTNGTTGLVGSVEFMKKDSGNWTSLNKKSSYEYDDVGNITDIKDINSNLIVHYEYDNLNQLTRENNVNLNKTIAYSYDLGGNIQNKKIYTYTTGDLTALTPDSTVVYGYSDSN